MFKAFPQVRTSSLKKVKQVNEMHELTGVGFREAAFEALAGEILDAFAAYPALEAVKFVFGVPKISYQLGSEDQVTDLIVQIEQTPSVVTEGAFVSEWEDDFSTFIENHFPLSKMGPGKYSIGRDHQVIQQFLAMDEANYPTYRGLVMQLMFDINASFGSQYTQQFVA